MLHPAMFVSGGATTAQYIINQCRMGKLLGLVNPAVVIASRREIEGVARCLETGVPIEICRRKDFDSPGAFGDAIIEICKKYNADFAGQYGWLVPTPSNVIDYFYEGSTHSRIVNQHPGPLDPPHPDFGGDGMYGRRVHAAVLAFNRIAKHPLIHTEATCHFVEHGGYDTGGLILTKQVPIMPDDTPETLATRVLPEEYTLQTEVLWFAARSSIPRMDRGTNRLIHPDDYDALEQAKTEAIAAYS